MCELNRYSELLFGMLNPQSHVIAYESQSPCWKKYTPFKCFAREWFAKVRGLRMRFLVYGSLPLIDSKISKFIYLLDE